MEGSIQGGRRISTRIVQLKRRMTASLGVLGLSEEKLRHETSFQCKRLSATHNFHPFTPSSYSILPTRPLPRPLPREPSPTLSALSVQPLLDECETEPPVINRLHAGIDSICADPRTILRDAFGRTGIRAQFFGMSILASISCCLGLVISPLSDVSMMQYGTDSVQGCDEDICPPALCALPCHSLKVSLRFCLPPVGICLRAEDPVLLPCFSIL